MKKNEQFNDLENAVMNAMLEGPDEVLSILREQFEAASLKDREKSESGACTRFAIPAEAKKLPPPDKFTIEDVDAEIPGLENGAGFELFIVDGIMDRLEAFCYDEKWPESIKEFKLFYHGGEQRNFPSLRMRWTR